MSLFRHKTQVIPRDKQIAIHKSANKKVVADAIKANRQLNQVLVNNGFTVKIAIAAGAKR